MPRVFSIRFGLALAFVFSLGTSRTDAGPTKYDPKTKSFRITYTFAALPSFGMSPDQIEQFGEIQKATPDQEANVRTIYKAVSVILEDVTAGRARIGSLDYVDNVKQADVIISLTGKFDRAGWAVSGQIEGLPGQIGLYYQYLADKAAQDIANTVAHELCHYLFALPDEYSSQPVAECPLQNPDSPGCLMDNYLVRHGFRRLCSVADHNADGPRNNPGTIVQGHKAEDSCQLWVDNFFKNHPPDESADSGSTDSSPGSSSVTAGSGSLNKLVNSATLKVREDAQDILDDLKKKKKPLPALSSSKLSSFAKKFLNDQIKQLIGDPTFLEPNSNQVNEAVKTVVDNVITGIKHPRPSRFNQSIIEKLKVKASELANALPVNERNLAQALLAEQTGKPRKDLKPLIAKVASDLLKFAATTGMKTLIGLSPPTPQQLAEEKLYINQLAREAVAGPGGASEYATYYQAAMLHIQLSTQTADTINALASELDVPGASIRRSELKEFQSRLAKIGLPGQTSQGFGKRRTYIVAPMPLDSKYDQMRIDAGDNLPYRDIRDLAVSQIKRLIRRERVEVLDNPVVAESKDVSIAQAKRFSDQVDLVKLLEENVRRDRAENIIIIAPPGGITNSLDDELEQFRTMILADSDVRVDVILFGEESNIPLRLRDMVAQSGGSVQSALDLDEIGAVAQRIGNEIAAGSWVSPPKPGYILLSNLNSEEAAAVAKAINKPKQALSVKELLKKYMEEIPKEEILSQISERRSLLSQSIVDIENFNKPLFAFIDLFVRNDNISPDYQSVRLTISNLLKLRDSLKSMKIDFLKLVDGPIDADTNDALSALLKKNYDTKQSLRTLFGSPTLFKSPLFSTDDYMDWTLRKLLVEEAKELNDTYLTPYGKISPFLRNRLTIDAVHVWQRSSMKSQKLADIANLFFESLKSSHLQGSTLPILGNSEAPEETLIEKTLREEFRIAPGASSLLLNAVDLLQEEIDLIQLEDEHSKPSSPRFTDSEINEFKALESRRLLNLKTDKAELPREVHLRYNSRTWALSKLWSDSGTDPGGLVKERIELQEAYHYYAEIFFLDLSARFLTRASALPLDYNRFSTNVATLVTQYEKLRQSPIHKLTADSKDISKYTKFRYLIPLVVSRREALQKSVHLLERRKEERLGFAVDALKQANQFDFQSSLESNDVVPSENGLTPLAEALEDDGKLDQLIKDLITPHDDNGKPAKNLPKDKFETYLGETNGKLDTMGLDWFSNHNDIKERVQQITYMDFPRLILDTLGRLREFEEDLRMLKQNLHHDQILDPLTQRVERDPATAGPDFKVSKDGHLTKIDFPTFQVEDQAEFELIIGFSRPLRLFKDLLTEGSQPRLRLYKNGEDDRLVDQPYLRFDPDRSTENMLVFRVPRPSLRAGYLDAGEYKVALLIDKKHMPILSRDNTVNYTFSVATPKPNVQLIAALRQNQPKEGDRDLTKDKEFAFRGTVPSNLSEVVVEVEVLAGAPVINSTVTGSYQMIRNDNDTIALPTLRFVDDGLYPDTKKDDGVYTARITLPPTAIRKPTEYRIYIEAKSNETDKYVQLAETIPAKPKLDDPTAPQNQAEPSVPTYQRSTSLNFHVSSEN